MFVIDIAGPTGLSGRFGVSGQGGLLNPVPKADSDSAYVDAAVKALTKFITEKIRAPVPAPATPAAPAPNAGQLRRRMFLDTMRAIRDLGYPGAIDRGQQQFLENDVMGGSAPSITMSASKNFSVENPTDPAAVATQARAFQAQYRNGNTQVGDVTITQTVAFKYRAQVVNLLLTIPSKDARLPGPTDTNVDLAGSIGEYFARGSRGTAPAQVRSLIAVVSLTVARRGAGGRTAGTTRTAGSSEFMDLVWNPNVRDAFREVRDEAIAESGHGGGYPGTIAAKTGYRIRTNDVMSEKDARAYADKDVNNNDKWDNSAFAVPVTRERVLATDKVTVTVTARDEKEALRQANMRIYATGRLPPNGIVQVSELVPKKVSETARTVTLEVTGTRKIVTGGTTDGWLFYGWAPS